MMKTFQEEQDELLKNIIDNFFNNYFVEGKEVDYSCEKGIELYITSVCNQECSYCYLVKNGDKLYPKNIRNQEDIINNLKILLQYFIDRELFIPRLDLFSGEIWGMKFGNTIFDVLLNYIKKGLKIGYIMIPSNCSFIQDKQVLDIIQNYIFEFRQCGVELKFSASVDGAIIDNDTRSYKNKEYIKDDRFYDRLFEFCIENNFGFHPMISKYCIDKQKENYVWWHNQFNKYNKDNIIDWYLHTMFLEVRNNEWDDETIKKYLEWLNFVIDYDNENLWKDLPIEFLYNILLNDTSQNNIFYKNNNQYRNKINLSNIAMSYNPISTVCSKSNRLTCTAGSFICVRLGDLSITPCHRTSYDKLIYGKFIVKDNQIVDIRANNPMLAFNIYCQGTSTFFKCDYCDIKNYCVKGCLGSQFESCNDIQFPIQSVCNFYHARAIFIYNKLHKFIEHNKLNEKYILPKTFEIDNIYNKIKTNNSEVIDKWESIIKPMIS